MKKIYSLIIILMLCPVLVLAQAPANRTAKTIVADVLSQLPAQKSDLYNSLMKDLSSTGEEGVLQLVKMMNAPGKGSNATIEYALSGLSHYVSAQGQDVARLATSNAYIKALDATADREVKAFIIRQLQIVAKDEAIAKLSAYLNDDSLCGPASRALASIASPAAGDALLNALNAAGSNKIKGDIATAIGEMKYIAAENSVRALLNSGDAALQKAVVFALSRIGSKASLPDLAIAAEKAGFTADNTGANEAYILLIRRVLAQGEVKEAEKAATALMKKAEKANQVQTRGAALQILMAAKPADVNKLLEKALKDNNREYRNAALTFALDYADASLCQNMLKAVAKAKPEVKADIINWMSLICNNADKRGYISTAGTNVLIAQLADSNPEVKKAAAGTLTKIGGEKSIAALANLLLNSNAETVKLGQNSLESVKGYISATIIPLLASAGDGGKIAILQLLANRKSEAGLGAVLGQIESSTGDVQAAAYTSLKDVVSVKDLPALYNLLESAQPAAVAPVQQAIIAALAGTEMDVQLAMVSQQIDKTPVNKQYLYYTVLASTRHPKALEIISALFGQQTGITKDAAFQALLDWKGMEVADELFAICKDPSASAYFDQAINKYIELIAKSGMTGENRRVFLNNAIEIAKTDAQKNEILKQIGQTNSYLGMLLAGEYLDQPPVQQAAAAAIIRIALNNKDYTGKNVETLLNKVIQVLDNPDAEYQRQELRTHLAEMPKEEGFVSIFNGKDLTGWKGLVENPVTRAKMKPADLAKKQTVADENMRRDWTVKDGLLIFDGKGYDNLCTEKQYGDFEMYVDWNLDPSGKEADAGVYLRGTPQVQMWDIARTNVGAQVGSGGLYNNQSNPSKPLKVADNKLGEWNNLYIKMVGDRVTVKLNGELVVDNVILENFWDRKQPIFPIEQIELQAHGSKVYFRNIYIKELERPEAYELTADEKKEGYKVLFDGTNMHQWTGNTVDYILEDGCISMHPSSNHGGNLYTKDEYGNFVFRFEFQLTPGANNGLGIRTPMEGDAAYVGMELQILDNDAPEYSQLEKYQYHGSVYGIIASKRGYLKPTGEWNYQEVIADGDNIKITLNGTVILDGNLKEATKNGTADKKNHPGLFNPKGHIGFLGHGSPLKFRNIRIKELK